MCEWFVSHADKLLKGAYVARVAAREPLVGRRVPRVNDARLLTGGARYLADLVVPGVRHAAILRSPIAHGRVLAIDATELETPVDLVWGPDEIVPRVAGAMPILWHLPNQFQHHKPVVDHVVRHVGETVGILVTSSPAAAEDALERIFVDVDPWPAVLDVPAALAPGAPVIHPDGGSNVMAAFDAGDSAAHTDAVFRAADRVLHFDLRIGRLAGAPIEPRGIVAIPEPDGRLTVYTSSQAPHAVRDALTEALGLPQHRLRVVAPDVGGGFGVKDHIYEDEVLVCLAALELETPVRWIESRRESLMVTHQARDEAYAVDVAVDDDGRLHGLRIDAVRDGGAWFGIFGGGPLFTMTGTVPGPYTWDAVRTTATVVATNTTPLGSYRGFGQTQAAFVRERALDLTANALGMDPVELRLANLVTPDQQPYALRTVPITFDNGDYPANVERARELAAAWPSAPDDGRVRGIGYATYVQMAGVGPSEGNKFIGVDIGGWERSIVRMEPDGTVRVIVGVSPHGQGHETTFAQLVADRLGIGLDQIELVHSDTDHTPYSAYGTAASRSIAVGGGATVRAADKLAARIRIIAGDLLEADAADIVLADGRATVRGTQVGVTMAAVAKRAWQGWAMPEGLEPGLIESATYDPTQFTFSFGTHVCRAAVDPDTGAAEIERYAVVHDCGTMVNPNIVEGQIHGGIAQGLGAALLEAVQVNDQGEPLTASFLDYLVPAAVTIPAIEIEHTITPSPFTPGGMKGMGEGGTNGSFACVVNAVAAAVPAVASQITETPITPESVWRALASPPTS